MYNNFVFSALNASNVLYLSDCQVVVNSRLKNKEAMEQETVTLEMKISQPRQVSWFKDDLPITNSTKFKLYVKSGGLDHSLQIINVSLQESGVYSVHVADDNKELSSCKLIIKGDALK